MKRDRPALSGSRSRFYDFYSEVADIATQPDKPASFVCNFFQIVHVVRVVDDGLPSVGVNSNQLCSQSHMRTSTISYRANSVISTKQGFSPEEWSFMKIWMEYERTANNIWLTSMARPNICKPRPGNPGLGEI